MQSPVGAIPRTSRTDSLDDVTTAEEASASGRGRSAVQTLSKAGKRLGLKVEVEYPILGGRIDVVWLWEGPKWFPMKLPVVGFEVESSWRTRKHIKGDFLNLVDLQPALGVIVLLGEGENVKGTRRFAEELVRRHGVRIAIWSQEDVERLGSSEVNDLRSMFLEPTGETKADLLQGESITHVGKYRNLAEWLARDSRATIPMTFAEIEEILGFPLPPFSRKHAAHWSSYEGSAVARAIHDAGWRASQVDMKSKRLTLERPT